MRAVVFTAQGELVLEDRPDPVPGPRDVVVQTAAIGICGTDTQVFGGEFGFSAPSRARGDGDRRRSRCRAGRPLNGSGHRRPRHGQSQHSLRRCEFCLTGRRDLCRFWNGLGVVASHGAAQERFTAPVSDVFRLRPDTDLFHAVLIEPLAYAIRGWVVLPRRTGDHVLVYGSGARGLIMAHLAPRAGAASVTIVDINADQLLTAAGVGIENRFTVADDADREQRDVVIDCTGNVRAIEDGLPCVKAGGCFQHFGVAPTEATTSYSPFRIYRDEVSIVGTMAVLSSFGRAVETFEAGAITPEPMICHSCTLDDYAGARDMFRAGTGRKLRVRPNDTQSRVLQS